MNGSERVIRFRKRLKHNMVLSMGGCCQICGYNACDNALDFHHIDPSNKEISFGSIRGNPKQLSLILDELKKCILVCCRCHREIHSNVIEIPKNYAKLDISIFNKFEEDGKYKDILTISKNDLLNENNLTVDEFCKSKNISQNKFYADVIKLGGTFKVKSRKLKFNPSYDELNNLVKNHSLCAVGRIYGVSDNAIRKRCIKLGIDFKK